jgi:hypothetical protein
MPDLAKQERKVYDFILTHPGCTTREISVNLWVQVPSAGITEMRKKKGVPIISIGHKKYEGARAFEMYKIDIPKPTPKPVEVSEQAKQLALSMTA